MDNNKQNIGTIETIDIEKEMRTSFISYAMAVIINRALPDVRDGLKPVHRRILYSMSEMGMTNDKPYRKCARIVGEVLGKYHPHGDTAVYDSLVRMAQPFSTRYPLVDGHGNFGSVDGDGAAAMRYTEARMSKIADELLSDIEKETVDFEPNFDETETQPTVLPSKIPNLLINGSGGIAVGMATNIPPHNLSEVADAAIALIENPDIALDGLMEYIKGPDFPTGGTIMGLSGIRSAYATGRGRVVVRAVAEIEEFGANRYRILVSELPYQVNKARLVEKIAEMVHEKRLDGISDLRDESDRNGMRIVIELKRDVNANVVLNNLYKHTQMQETFGVIMLALVDREPRVLSLKEMLRHYVDHRTDVVTRRTRYELDRAEARSHILEGLLIALDHIDEVIRIIRSSQEDGEAKTRLMEAFGLSDRQSQAILDMRLRRLTGLESERIQAEYDALQLTIARLRAILSDIDLVLSIIKEELTEMKQQYGDQRRTQIAMVEGEVDIEDLIQKEDMVVTLTRYGYIKRIAADTYRSQNRGGKGITGLTTREEDFVETVFITSTHTPILFFTNTGRVFTLKCYQLPLGGRTARGSAIVNLLRLEAGESIKTVLPLDAGDGGRYLVMATKEGIIKKTPASEFQNIRQNGLIALNLREEDALASVFLTSGEDEILVGSRLGMAIRFHESDVRSMGRTATGVRSIRLKKGDEVLDVARLDKRYLLVITENGYGKMTLLDEYHRQTRGGQGVRTLHLTPKTGPVAGLKMVAGDEDLVLIDQDGTIIRTSASQVSVLSRSTQGVKVMRVGDDSRVAAIALIAPQEEFEDSDSPETSDPEE